MPKPPVAHQSSSHRRACLSLYKSLLKRSSVTQAAGLRSLIQHRFRADRLLQSPSQIANGLNAGHEVLNLLQASEHGDKPSIGRLISLLESTLRHSKSNENCRSGLQRASTSCGRAPKANNSHRRADPLQSHPVLSRPLLERPLPLAEIKNGKRRVPSFKVVQGVPFLFYSKPQPEIVGKMISQKGAWASKKWEQRNQLSDETIPLGEAEDAWDNLVDLNGKHEGVTNGRCAGNSNSDNVEPNVESWASASYVAESRIAQQLKQFEIKNLEMSRQMVDIMKQERALAAKEKADLAAIKYERRVLRRADEFLAAAAGNKTSKHEAG